MYSKYMLLDFKRGHECEATGPVSLLFALLFRFFRLGDLLSLFFQGECNVSAIKYAILLV